MGLAVNFGVAFIGEDMFKARSAYRKAYVSLRYLVFVWYLFFLFLFLGVLSSHTKNYLLHSWL